MARKPKPATSSDAPAAEDRPKRAGVGLPPGLLPEMDYAVKHYPWMAFRGRNDLATRLIVDGLQRLRREAMFVRLSRAVDAGQIMPLEALRKMGVDWDEKEP